MKALRDLGLAVLLGGAMASTAAFAAKEVESATLRDLQTVGSTKELKHQQYDFVLDTSSSEYTCRTELGKTVKATEFVVGSPVQFEIKGQNGEVRNMAGNKVKCGIVRVAGLSAPQ